jgi:hypothetical protein
VREREGERGVRERGARRCPEEKEEENYKKKGAFQHQLLFLFS